MLTSLPLVRDRLILQNRLLKNTTTMWSMTQYVIWYLEEGKRLDGRTTTQIRPIWSEIGYLPSAHGSAMFYPW